MERIETFDRKAALEEIHQAKLEAINEISSIARAVRNTLACLDDDLKHIPAINSKLADINDRLTVIEGNTGFLKYVRVREDL